MIDTTNMGIMANYIQPTTSTMANHMISKKDTDSDSSLTIDEMGISSELFSSYDSNLDGLVNQAELTSAIDTAMSQFDGEMPSKEQFQSVLSSFGFEPPSGSNNNSLSSSQLDTISSVLENYDSDNLSQNDAQEIVSAFKEAGIQPGSELESAMAQAGFDAYEVGTLAGVGQAQGGPPPPPAGSGAGTPPSSSSDSEEEYDVMDLNEDGVVSSAEVEEYYGIDNKDSSENLSQNQQNSLDNLKLLRDTLKGNNEELNTNSFDGILKLINEQNNNSNINTYLQNTSTSSMFDYA